MTKNQIKATAYEVIKELVGVIWEYDGDDQSLENTRLVTLGSISGVFAFVDRLLIEAEDDT